MIQHLFAVLAVLFVHHASAQRGAHLQNSTWVQLPSTGLPPPQRASMAMMTVAMTDTDFTLGMFGGTVFVRDFNDFWLFSSKTKSWKQQSRRGQISERSYPFNWIINQSIYIFAGKSQTRGLLDDFWSFSLDNFMWNPRATAATTPTARYKGISFIINATLLGMFGGFSHDGTLNDMWFMDTNSGDWTRVLTANGSEAMNAISADDLAGVYYETLQRLYVYDTRKRTFFFFDFRSRTWNVGQLVGAKSSFPSPRTLTAQTGFNYSIFVACGTGGEDEILNDIWGLDVRTGTWATVLPLDNTAISPRTSPGLHALTSGKLVLFGGLQDEPINDMYIISSNASNVSSGSWVPVMVHDDAIVPCGRSYHNAFEWDGDLAVFGGQCNGVATRGLWLYTFVDSSWIELTVTVAPASRFGHAFAFAEDQGQVIVFGGQGTLSFSDIYRDMWSLTMIHKATRLNWELITPEGTIPSARAFMGYTLAGLQSEMLFIYGGGTEGAVLADMWIYDLLRQKWTMVSAVAEPGPRERCAMISNNTHLILLGGKNQKLTMSDSIWIYTISTAATSAFVTGWVQLGSTLPVMSPALVLIRQNPFHALIIGGERDGILDPYGSDMYVLNEVTIQKAPETNTPVRTGAAAVMIGSIVYLFGGLFPSQNGDTTFENAVNDLFWYSIKPICHLGLGETCFGCPPGSLARDRNCSLCPKGTFNEEWGQETCQPCPAGTYSNFEGVGQASDCFFCLAGTYSPNPGSQSCLPCPKTVEDVCHKCECPVGASSPHEKDELNRGVTVVQFPTKPPTQMPEIIIEYDYIITFCLIGLLTGVFLILRLMNFQLTRKLRRLDYFMSDMHVSRDMFTKRVPTTTGGLCTCYIFIFIIAGFVAISAFPLFSTSKLVRTTIPRTVISADVVGAVRMRLTLLGFQGVCTAGGSCPASFGFTPSNFVILAADTPKCVRLPRDCLIEWYCTKCVIRTLTVQLEFLTVAPVSAEAIQWEVMTMSSHGTPSIVGSTIYPSDPDIYPLYPFHVPGAQFRGITLPTIIRNQFLINVAREPKTRVNPAVGYVVHHDSAVGGSYYKGGPVSDDGMKVQFNFALSSYAVLDSSDLQFYDAFLSVMFLGTIPGVITLMTMTFRFVQVIFFKFFVKMLSSKIIVDKDSYKPSQSHFDHEEAKLLAKEEDEYLDEEDDQEMAATNPPAVPPEVHIIEDDNVSLDHQDWVPVSHPGPHRSV